jgi:hypothetical protein
MKISVTVHSDEAWEREPDPDDRWDSGSSVLGNIHVSIWPTDADYGWDVTPAADGTVCVLVEHFSDGDTFGNYESTDVKGVFTDQADAELFANSCPKDHGYFGSHIGFLYFIEKV